jgi:serine/threonine-protein kinase
MAVLSINQQLDRRYRIVQVLSSGSLGQTYLAVDMRRPGYPQCIVRQFQFPSKSSKTLQVVQLLFKKKAETLERLGNHDRIPQLLACFEQEGQVYFVEEAIVGHPLSRELVAGRALSEEYVIRFLDDVLEVLDYVHKNGVIHRNLRPTTLMRRQGDNRIVPIDFGLLQEIANPSPKITKVIPKDADPSILAYMPPEQLQGNPLYNSDLYAIGAICVQALTGCTPEELPRPHEGNGSRPMTVNWRDRAKISPALGDYVDRMICPYFEQRYQSAEAALRDLRRLYGTPSGISLADSAALSGARSYSQSQTSYGDWLIQGQQRVRQWFSSPRRLVGTVVGTVAAAALLYWLAVPVRASYLRDRGRTALSAGNATEAIAHYNRSLALRPNDARTLYQRAAAYIDQRDFQAAIDDLNRAVEIQPDYAPAYFERANARYYLGDWDGSLADYDRALERRPDFASAYLNRGNVRADMGDDTAAIADYDRAIAQAKPGNPALAAAYLNRGLSRSNLDDQQGAIEDATQAIQLNPNYAFAYQNRGLAYRRMDNLQAAIEDFNVAIQLAPDDPDPYYNRGLARYELGELQGAVEDFNRAIERNPDHALVYYDRGVARLRQGDRAGAIADFQESAKLCLDLGRVGCYRDAQYQIQQIQAGNPETNPGLAETIEEPDPAPEEILEAPITP